MRFGRAVWHIPRKFSSATRNPCSPCNIFTRPRLPCHRNSHLGKRRRTYVAHENSFVAYQLGIPRPRAVYEFGQACLANAEFGGGHAGLVITLVSATSSLSPLTKLLAIDTTTIKTYTMTGYESYSRRCTSSFFSLEHLNIRRTSGCHPPGASC